MSAGIVFKSETHVLMGYQPDKNMISGIGGKPIGHETPIETAFRETIEELFGIQPSKELLEVLVNNFGFKPEVKNTSYTMFIYTIEELLRFLCVVKSYSGSSPYYTNFPTSLDSLIFNRRTPLGVEVGHLCMVPIIHVPFHIDQRDMNVIG
jgi:hypothetical protein